METFVVDRDIFPLTFEKAVEMHRKYWSCIAENGLERKPDIVYEDGESADIFADCFLCEYTLNYLSSLPAGSRCRYCPANIGNDSPTACLDGLYFDWKRRPTIENALAIRDIPMKEK